MKTKLILVAVLTLALSAQAQNQNQGTTIPEQWSRTLRLTGAWKADATLSMGDQSLSVVYRMNYKKSVDGNALTMDEGFSDAALGVFQGTNLIGYSPFDDRIHWFSVDNLGTAHEHTGYWSDASHFYMEHSSLQDGKVYMEKIDCLMQDGDQKFEVNLVVTLDGVTVETVTGTFVRSNRP